MNAARYDAIVVGAGLAGMMTAFELRPLRVALVSYRSLGEGTSSAWAQGGIAAAVGDDDSPAQHAADTVAAGAGLVEQRVAARLAAEAPHAIERIASLGVRFDRTDAAHYALGREAAHSRRRILRAGGDATGAELVRAVVLAVRSCPSVVPIEGALVTDVRLHEGRVCGVTLRYADGTRAMLAAPAVVLATGGIGGLYRFTTNPTSSLGLGLAVAARVGARLSDLEFVQFHPTALDVPCDPLPLVTEALRGEGALLVDETGARIMAGVAGLELAPRDVVARAVFQASKRGGRAFLDARHVARGSFEQRFPTVFAACRRFGIDPTLEPIPVVAAAHYHMGGIAVDQEGRSSVAGLYACGESAATGVHGANRLASNSLLESVVYPERIADDIRANARAGAALDRLLSARRPREAAITTPDEYAPTAAEALADVRETMYTYVGVERDAVGLAFAVERLEAVAANAAAGALRDAATVGAAVAQAALRRRESRGSHQRSDFPQTVASEKQRSYSPPQAVPTRVPAAT